VIFLFCQVAEQEVTLVHVVKVLPSTVIVIDAMPLAEFAETATLTLLLIWDPLTGALIVTIGGVGVLVVPGLEVEVVPVLVVPVLVVPVLVVPVLVVPVLVVPVLEVEVVPVLVVPVLEVEVVPVLVVPLVPVLEVEVVLEVMPNPARM
jgi:hypothetical protein